MLLYDNYCLYYIDLFRRAALGACGIGGVECVEILLIQMLLRSSENIAESLKMHDFALTKETDDVVYVGVIGQSQNVVVGGTRLLLC